MITFDEVCMWINRNSTSNQADSKSGTISDPDFGSSLILNFGRNLGISANCLINQMKVAFAEKDYAKTKKIIALLDSVIQKSNKSLEIAEVSYECGIALYRMGDFGEAGLFLHQAITKYGIDNYHNQAIAIWALGEVYWQVGEYGDAFNHWERSYEIFKLLSKTNIEPQWYGKRSEQIKETIEQRSNVYS